MSAHPNRRSIPAASTSRCPTGPRPPRTGRAGSRSSTDEESSTARCRSSPSSKPRAARSCARRACVEERLEHGPDVVGDETRSFGGRMDAVALVERIVPSDAIEQERQELYVGFLGDLGINAWEFQ